MKKGALVLTLAIALSGCNLATLYSKPAVVTAPPQPTTTKSSDDLIEGVVLKAQNGSKQEGVATLQEVDGKVKVMIAVTSLGTAPQPAHIHVGACPNPGAVKYPLTSV